MSGVDIESGTSEYAATAAGVLWVSLVHEPWKSLEFAGYDYADEDVEFFLTETDEDTRNNKVQEIREDNPKAFSKSTAGQRMGQGAIMFLTMLFKCIVYILIAVILLLFQIFTVILVLLAPVILLMALMPVSYTHLLTLSMAMVSFASGANYAENAAKWGFEQAFWVVPVSYTHLSSHSRLVIWTEMETLSHTPISAARQKQPQAICSL